MPPRAAPILKPPALPGDIYLPVLLDPIDPNDFPMGHYTIQGIRWDASDISGALRRIREEVEAKAMPRWMKRKLDEARSHTSIGARLADNEACLLYTSDAADE